MADFLYAEPGYTLSASAGPARTQARPAALAGRPQAGQPGSIRQQLGYAARAGNGDDRPDPAAGQRQPLPRPICRGIIRHGTHDSIVPPFLTSRSPGPAVPTRRSAPLRRRLRSPLTGADATLPGRAPAVWRPRASEMRKPADGSSGRSATPDAIALDDSHNAMLPLRHPAQPGLPGHSPRLPDEDAGSALVNRLEELQPVAVRVLAVEAAHPGKSSSNRTGAPAARSRPAHASRSWTSRPGWALRAGRKSCSTPKCSSMPWPRNQQPPRAASTVGLATSAKPSTPP